MSGPPDDAVMADEDEVFKDALDVGEVFFPHRDVLRPPVPTVEPFHPPHPHECSSSY